MFNARIVRLIACLGACWLASAAPAQTDAADATETAETAGFDFPREFFYNGDDDGQWAKISSMFGKSSDVLGFTVRDWAGTLETDAALSPNALRGRVVVLQFFRTNDTLSHKAVPFLNGLYTTFAEQGVEVIGICSERGGELADQMVAEQGVKFVTCRDTFRATAKAFGLQWHPWTVIIDRKGIVRAAGVKPEHVSGIVAQIVEAQPAASAFTPRTLRTEYHEDAGISTEVATADTADPIPEEWVEASFTRYQTLLPLIGKRAPALELDNWRNGYELKLREQRGKVIMLYFWRLDDPRCVRMCQLINALHKKHRDDGLLIIGVADRVPGEELMRFIRDKNIEFRIAIDQNRATINTYQVDGYPDFYFIDRAGYVRGVDIKTKHLPEMVDMLLAESP